MTSLKLSKGSKILLIGGGLWYFGEGMFGPLLALFTERIGGDVLNITWAWATYLMFYGVLSIVIGYLSDTRFSKEKLMVIGYAVNAVFTFGYLFVDDPISLLLVQAGLGVAAALATPTWNALFDEWSKEHVDGYAWGISEGVASIVTAISIVVGGLVVTKYGFIALFTIMGSVQVLATFYQARIFLLPTR